MKLQELEPSARYRIIARSVFDLLKNSMIVCAHSLPALRQSRQAYQSPSHDRASDSHTSGCLAVWGRRRYDNVEAPLLSRALFGGRVFSFPVAGRRNLMLADGLYMMDVGDLDGLSNNHDVGSGSARVIGEWLESINERPYRWLGKISARPGVDQ